MCTNILLLFALLTSHNIRIGETQGLGHSVGKLQEVFAWKQLTYNINGNILNRDRFSSDGLENGRVKRQMDNVFFNDNVYTTESNRNHRTINPPFTERYRDPAHNLGGWKPNDNRPTTDSGSNHRPSFDQSSTTATTPSNNGKEENSFFIQYNNVPMGVEKHENRLFITVPRRRYGIPSTLNYLDLNTDRNRSPGLRPYPDLATSRSLISVYRTRVDTCNRLWMIDTGRLEIPNAHRQVQPPAIVVFDLLTDRQIFRYQFQDSDLPQENTPTGLASITVDIQNGDCDGAYAYVPELTSYGLIVYSLKENNTWRLSHNYFSFNPAAGNLNLAGQRFQWSDGIFSITLSNANGLGCRTAYFHPLISTHEFSVSTCQLKNRTLASSGDAWESYSIVGDRGTGSQSTMHGYHSGTRALFFAEVGRNAVTCWQTSEPLVPSNVGLLAQDNQRLLYPSDLHVTDDEVWLMANSMPRFNYARLDTNEYNFFIYRGNVNDLISGTVCEPPRRGK